MKQTVKTVLTKILSVLPEPQHPSLNYSGLHLRWRIGYLKGLFFKWYISLRKLWNPAQVTIGERFSLQGKLRIRGFGTIVIGNDVIIDGKTDLYTAGPYSSLSIGNRCFLNGTRFGVEVQVTVEEDCILSDSRIMDSDYHSLAKNRLSKEAIVLRAPVYIERNVWIAAQTAILRGVRIGKDSVVSFGAVVTKDVEAGKIVGGVPAKVIGDVPL